jgi:hypothetical protein
MYKLRVTNGTSNPCLIDAFDIITPIHVHKTNSPATLQNTLAIGSQGLTDSRTTSTTTTTKAWAQALSVTSPVQIVNQSANVPIPDMSVTIKTSGGALYIWFTVTVYSSNYTPAFTLYVDGLQVSQDFSGSNAVTTATPIDYTFGQLVPVSSGFHKVDIHWRALSGTVQVVQRVLTVQEK